MFNVMRTRLRSTLYRVYKINLFLTFRKWFKIMKNREICSIILRSYSFKEFGKVASLLQGVPQGDPKLKGF